MWEADMRERLEDSLVCGENTTARGDSMIHEEETDTILNQTHAKTNPFTSSNLSNDGENKANMFDVGYFYSVGQTLDDKRLFCFTGI